MPAALPDPAAQPRTAPASIGPRTWLTIGAGLLLFVLVPFALVGSWFEALATDAVRSSAPHWLLAAAIVVLLALDIVLPVPSSVVSTAAGAALGFWPGLAASALGMTAGRHRPRGRRAFRGADVSREPRGVGGLRARRRDSLVDGLDAAGDRRGDRPAGAGHGRGEPRQTPRRVSEDPVDLLIVAACGTRVTW
jgi:hypothetical protein